MSVIILAQPDHNNIHAAYKPLCFTLQVDQNGLGNILNEPPMVLADVYANGTYYRTIQKTQPYYKGFVGTIATNYFTIDIQKICQEYLESRLQDIALGTGLYLMEDSVAKNEFQVYFRYGYHDSDGVTQQEGPEPVQESQYVLPAAGGGIASQTFHVLNAVLQTENNPYLDLHLESFAPFFFFGSNYRATHLPLEKCAARNDLDFIYTLTSVIPIASPMSVSLTYTQTDGTTTTPAPVVLGTPASSGDFMLVRCGTGPQQMQNLFPAVPWGDVVEFTMGYGAAFYEFCRQTYKLLPDSPDNLQVTFMNYLGTFDTMTFCSKQEYYSTKSEQYESPLAFCDVRDKTIGGTKRYSIEANDKIIVTTKCYNEKQKDWIKQLLDSPKIFVFFRGSRYEFQDDGYIGYVIGDVSDFQLVKDKKRWYSEFKFVLSPAISTMRQH